MGLRTALDCACRALLPAAVLLCAGGIAAAAHAGDNTRTLTIYNIHTKKTHTITYKKNGEFIPEGMKKINYVMRDWRRDEPTEMDPELIDTIWALYNELGSREPIHLISGYRSRKTNNMLRSKGGGQARNSRHILGKAADIHFPDVSAKKLRNSALVREVGGVGYYPGSALPFVHVDTGRVRHWPRLPRQELALLFPSGHTKHVPRDGKPLTRKDVRVAMAKRQKRIDDFISEKSEVKLPPMMQASFTPPPLPAEKDEVITTASIPEESPASPAPDSAATPARGLRRVALNAPDAPTRQNVPLDQARIDYTQQPDPGHTGELSYRPFSILPLMNDTPVSADRRLARLQSPDSGGNASLFSAPESGVPAQLSADAGYEGLGRVEHFASAESTQGKPIRTASR